MLFPMAPPRAVLLLSSALLTVFDGSGVQAMPTKPLASAPVVVAKAGRILQLSFLVQKFAATAPPTRRQKPLGVAGSVTSPRASCAREHSGRSARGASCRAGPAT